MANNKKNVAMVKNENTTSGFTANIVEGELVATVAESNITFDTIGYYENAISAMIEIGKTATLKIVEFIRRVDIKGLYKASNDEKGIAYSSLNQWAIDKFGFSKSHVSEMISVAKRCGDVETGVIKPCFAGLSYSQLLALTKNSNAIVAIESGKASASDIFNMTAKEISKAIAVVDDKKPDSISIMAKPSHTARLESVDKPSIEDKTDKGNTDNKSDNGNAIARIRHFKDLQGARDSKEVTLHILKNGKTLIYGYENTTIEFANELAGLNYLLSAYEVVDANDTPFATTTVSATAKA